ncbi:hypothetical protein SAMN05444412_108110 [Rhodonellum ikkaensis]|uniref:Uncharacterized protein n=1 Tax=Rhodonellum ikkaensis TaxID=336829 RepID=A0A1H3RGP2_9BACT|nr:hypothetical protein SAMN05444412_108110 [Rhodonellum ikkaensis]
MQSPLPKTRPGLQILNYLQFEFINLKQHHPLFDICNVELRYKGFAIPFVENETRIANPELSAVRDYKSLTAAQTASAQRQKNGESIPVPYCMDPPCL